MAIVSAGAAGLLGAAPGAGSDAFLTGEPAEPTMMAARELGIHFVAGGHYATERLGVQALSARQSQEFDLGWHFIELTNPVCPRCDPAPPRSKLRPMTVDDPRARRQSPATRTHPPARPSTAAGLFHCLRSSPEGGAMPNHLTPEELSKEVGMEREDVIRFCVEEGVPIYQGKIDKTLFQAQLEATAAKA